MIQDKTATVNLHELAEYVIYNKVNVTVVSPTQTEQRFMALAFGVLLDDLLPECGQYHSQPRLMELENGSRVWFDFNVQPMRSRHLHLVVFEKMHETIRHDYEIASGRCRIPGARGVRFFDL